MPNSDTQPADRVVGPLRAARRPLHTGLRQVQQAASALDADPRVALAALDTAVHYLRSDLAPILHAEEFVLFPAVDGVIGNMGASDIMRAQHAAIVAMIEDLERVAGAARADGSIESYRQYLVPLLHGLYAAVRLHLESEEVVWITLLDEHLSESQVQVIIDNLDRVSSAHRDQMSAVSH
ncbi:MAG: hemerythrin domain-containing protein [Dehalococcoidia bacterium]|nr:hemerythrin domain-containing protein [Dehalococcoidia bacterium]